MATYKKSEERYEGGGQVKYLVYQSPQKLRDGSTQQRRRVKRLYFPTDARDIRIDGPGRLEKRSGRKVYGVAVNYRYELASTTAQRGSTHYDLPQRTAKRSKIVELPDEARNVRLTNDPPSGPMMDVA